MKTFLVFLDLPVHVEHRVDDMPLIPSGTVIGFRATLCNPRNMRQTRKIEGDYLVVRVKLLYSTKGANSGLVQYLELDAIRE